MSTTQDTSPTPSKARPDIINHKGGGTTIQGKDGINYFRALQVKLALSLYAKTGIIPTRGVTIMVLFKIAKEYTGKDYKRGEAMKAHDDMKVCCETMKAALDIRGPGEQRGSN